MKLFVGAIFIMSVIGGASASIISRGFFDEAMKNYALKNDVGDVAALQSKIGTLPTGTVRWLNNYIDLHCDIPGICMTDITLPTDIGGLLSLLYSDDKDAPSVTNLLDMMINGFLYGPDYIDGLYDLNARLSSLDEKNTTGWLLFDKIEDNLPYKSELFNTYNFVEGRQDMHTVIHDSFFDASFPGLAGVVNKLLNGWTNAEDETYLGLKEINTKVKATELPSDTDDGQYVLTAKKINGNITYTWVKMDLTDSEK